MLELHCGRDHRVVDHRIADDLAGSRATNDGSALEVAAQLTHELTGLDQRSGAKDENYTLPSTCSLANPVSTHHFATIGTGSSS